MGWGVPLLPPPSSAEDFAELALPRPRWLVEDLLPGDGWTLLVAKAKTGKSLLAMQLAAALHAGGMFLGTPVAALTKVLYIQLDAPPNDWQEQVRRLQAGKRGWATYTTEQIPLYVLDGQYQHLQVQLRERIKAGGYGLVIWDALEKLTRQDTNKKEGCQILLDRMKAVNPGPNLVIHHPRKPHGETSDGLVDAASGNHYLTADASAIWGLQKTAPTKGVLQVVTRASDVKLQLEREPKTYLWLPSKHKPQEGLAW